MNSIHLQTSHFVNCGTPAYIYTTAEQRYVGIGDEVSPSTLAAAAAFGLLDAADKLAYCKERR